jgi:hypothetical protein
MKDASFPEEGKADLCLNDAHSLFLPCSINHLLHRQHTLRSPGQRLRSKAAPFPSGMIYSIRYQPATMVPNPRPQTLEPRLSSEQDPSSVIPWKVWFQLFWLLAAANLEWKPLENVFLTKFTKSFAASQQLEMPCEQPLLEIWLLTAFWLLEGNQKPMRK